MGTRGLNASTQEGFVADRAQALQAQPTASADGTSHRHNQQCKMRHTRNPLKICAMVAGRVIPNTLLAIVGLDLYTKGKGAEGMVKAVATGSGGNPFDVGLIRNTTDFWTRGRTREAARPVPCFS
jgi:palmitoyltransferase